MAAVTEDSIVKNRLLFDNRQLKKCIRRYILQGASGKENDSTLFLGDLAQLEVGLQKHQLIHDMTEKEIRRYDEAKEQIALDIEQRTKDLAILKEQLIEAQRIRANKLQYDALAEKILGFPRRGKSIETAAKLKVKIEKTINETETVRQKQELRRKQLLTLVTAIHEIQDAIADDRQADEARNLEESYAEEPPTPPQEEEEEEGMLMEEEGKDAMDTRA
ncbi:uncharacterized protein EV422DRAFT_535386 [Fimicolochytrium jonesii]|uniref:uncharacterized protein n=1 Tax=Fimicolochytrium jonesii TaxID=1396493 RepID=UPI0022FDCC05|nr:uncharacterized protein EV422DRAFT_535386 [Fimicolochytrium jonesii]KAI8819175.1 hypothetical protein EV422DRAFT_535386 [Fimicolochytrium jonesii]